MSRAEYAAFVHQHETRFLQHFAVILAVFLVSVGVVAFVMMAGVVPWVYAIGPLIMSVLAVLFCIWQGRENAETVPRALAGRDYSGHDRSDREARMLRMALSGWAPLVICTVVAAFALLSLADGLTGEDAAATRWWVVIVLPTLALWGGWILLKLRAIRAYRAAGGLPVRAQKAPRMPSAASR
ncbi:hypothetical protein ACSBM8_03660 [Sphingomonas sp. ASY06-1R]|uniref:hypothetical protein n=1 Tax=Sphingomonas sp. ASY06-1R TaxID=3445771 RepID=UPI003FA1D448